MQDVGHNAYLSLLAPIQWVILELAADWQVEAVLTHRIPPKALAYTYKRRLTGYPHAQDNLAACAQTSLQWRQVHCE